MLDAVENPILVALATATAIWLGGMIRSFVGRRVHIQSPEAAMLEQLVPAVNILIEVQGPQMVALTAILEAQKGICNGNVDAALDTTRSAKKSFDDYLVGTAKVWPSK